MTKEESARESLNSTVGYCNPPKHTQFRKGQSGNPRGRPKGTLNVATVLDRTLRERVVINENGRRKTVTKLEAALKQLTNKAASGELKALQLLASLVRSAEERGTHTLEQPETLGEKDKSVVLNILKRIEGVRNEGGNNEAIS